jgi:hypothetical protein
MNHSVKSVTFKPIVQQSQELLQAWLAIITQATKWVMILPALRLLPHRFTP